MRGGNAVSVIVGFPATKPLGTLSMKTSFTPAAAAALYSLAVATGSVGIDTMILGF